MNRRSPFPLLAKRSSWFLQANFIVLVLALFLSSMPKDDVYAAAGDLDQSFGMGGKIAIDFLGTASQAQAIAIQSNGKIVVAGLANFDFAIARFNSDGTLDASFGSGGKVTTGFSSDFDEAHAIAIQSDGKIVVAGIADFGSGASDFALARYNSDGSLDLGFGSGGKTRTDFFGSLDAAHALAIQNDGKIVVAGFTATSPLGHGDFAVARYNSNGSLDQTFGAGGKVNTDFFDGSDPFFAHSDSANALAIQADGKIVLAGSAISTTSSEFALARYNSNGSLDTNFGSNGKVMTDFFGGEDTARAVMVQNSGKILVGGSAVSSSHTLDFALARYNQDGSLDTSFGSNGKTLTDFSGSNDEANALVVQGNGKVALVGTALNSQGVFVFGVSRYNADGSLDSSFGVGGKMTTSFFNSNDFAMAGAVQNDGKIVAVGTADYRHETFFFTLARYESDSPIFDTCIQDDSSGNLLQINTTTGEYQFTNCAGLTVGGTGTITRRGNQITLQQASGDRRVTATIDTGTKKAAATIQLLSQGRTFSIIDKNITNNSCACK